MPSQEGGLTQGARANKNGQIGEDSLVPLFRISGYEVVPYGDYNRHRERYDALPRLVVKQYPYVTIYDHPGKTEFLIVNRELNRRIRVEVKWQQSAGSVDEKYPYLWLNAIGTDGKGFPEDEIILIIDGGGYKQGAHDWITRAAKDRWLLDDKPQRTIRVMSIAEFIAFFTRELR